eukprot:TRINITY_DN2009_c4_g1_i1.p1 TRINITY_DN2009_c4_g1~~TRINITY_DN2009_c4_g1_i1.p1  ORF type:complete len:185 (-),score=-11.25 TRINITY_DN2009_c4_g1_i1:259-813(-)
MVIMTGVWTLNLNVIIIIIIIYNNNTIYQLLVEYNKEYPYIYSQVMKKITIQIKEIVKFFFNFTSLIQFRYPINSNTMLQHLSRFLLHFTFYKVQKQISQFCTSMYVCTCCDQCFIYFEIDNFDNFAWIFLILGCFQLFYIIFQKINNICFAFEVRKVVQQFKNTKNLCNECQTLVCWQSYLFS